MKNGTEHDMTQGAVAVPLIGFTIPLVLGNFFQLFYNAADSIIVGRYVGERALAAVGTSTPVMNLVILLISGLLYGGKYFDEFPVWSGEIMNSYPVRSVPHCCPAADFQSVFPC